ncbi:zinc-ribbon domain-containing protein [Dysosmobacter sp.]
MNEQLMKLLESVRATACQVQDTAASAAYGMGKRAQALVSVAKMNMRLAELNAQIERQLRAVGEMIYATHTGHPTHSEALLSKLQEIDALQAQASELSREISRAQPRCPTCGAPAQPEDRFCRECGGSLERGEF